LNEALHLGLAEQEGCHFIWNSIFRFVLW